MPSNTTIEVSAFDWKGMTLRELRLFVRLTETLDEELVPEVEYVEVTPSDWEPTYRAIRSLEVKA
jgi:hypothetical protein